VAISDSFLGIEDTVLTGDVSLNDSDVDGDTLTYTPLGGPYPGVVLNADGTFTYTPPANFNGLFGFEYTVSDGQGGSANAGVVINVAAVNDAPVGVDDAASTAFNTPVVIDVLANDSDVEGDILAAGGVTAPANGTLSNVGATITYTPNVGFSGTDSFTYRPFDGTVQGNVTTVTVTVAPSGNVAPVAVADSFSVQEGRTLAVAGPGLLANDSDANGDAIIAANFTNPSAQGGVVSMVTDGSFTYTPPDGFSGADTFQYRIFDGTAFSDFATVTITVIEGTPIAAADSFSVHWSDVLTVAGPGLLANDSDPNGDAIIAANFTNPSAQGGAVSMVTDGSFTYTPPAAFLGTDTFQYRISDGVLFSEFATVTVNVTNDAPVASADSFSVQEGRTLNVVGPGLLANDADANGDTVIAANFTNPSAQGGVVSMVTDGSFTYTPPAGFSGIDTFEYRIFDGIEFSDFVTVTVNVIEGTPIAAPDVFTVVSGQVLTVAGPGLLANDSDPNGDAIIAANFTNPSAQGGVVSMVTDGSFTYTPPAGFVGTDSFTYRISDGVLFSEFATVTINVTAPVNTAPVATDAVGLTLEDVAVAFDLEATDAQNNITGFSILSATNGSVSGFNPLTGEGVFTPGPNFNGQAVITFRVTDAEGLFDDGSLTIEVIPVNDAPVGVDDPASTAFNTPVVINVLANDTDVEGDALVAGGVTAPANGTLSSVGGTITYTPNAGFSGVDSFTYRPFDGALQGNVTTVTVTVTAPPNAPPVAVDDAITIQENAGYYSFHFVDVLANDTDADGDPLDVVAIDTTGTPIIADMSGGQLRFFVNDPSENTNGTFVIGYTVSDGVDTDQGQVTITVTPQNDPPIDPEFNDNALGLTTAEDTPLVISIAALLADDANPPDEAQVALLHSFGAYAGVTLADNGDGTLTFTPPADFNGTGVFFYYAKDEFDAIGPLVTVPVTVTPVNDLPVAADDFFTVSGAGPFVLPIADPLGGFNVRGNDRNPDGFPNTSGDTLAIVDVVQVSGGSVMWDGFNVTFTPDGSGNPMVFAYTVEDADSDQATAQVTLEQPQALSQLFYFSGSVPDFGRELWVYDPASSLSGAGGDPFATMVDAAEVLSGTDSGDPHEITALGNTVFWRGEEFGAPYWFAYRPDLGLLYQAPIADAAFDAALPLEERDLGVRAGDYFWGASWSDELYAWDQFGNFQGSAFLGGHDRSLLTDAGHDPAYAAIESTYDPVTDSFLDAEQLFALLYNGNGNFWEGVQLTGTGSDLNDIREIAGLAIQDDPAGFGEQAKTLFFAGDYTDHLGVLYQDALWKVTSIYDGFSWSNLHAPQRLDPGSVVVPTETHALTTVGGIAFNGPNSTVTLDRLFYLGRNAAGDGAIATYLDDHYGVSGITGQSTSTDYFGTSLQGLEIRPWQDGVVFSGIADVALGPTPFVATWTDADGDGFFDLLSLWEQQGDGVVEHLTVDGQGNAAWVLDEGDFDTLYVFQSGLGFTYDVVQRFGEIDELQLADGHLVYRMNAFGGGPPTLFDHTLATQSGIEVPTDEATGGGGADGFTSKYANVAVAGGLVFEADIGNGLGFFMFTIDGTGTVNFPGGGTRRTSEGATLNGNWVGTAYVTDFALNGLYSISATGVVNDLYLASTNFSNEAEVLGDQVLFGTTSAAVNEILIHDSGLGSTFTLLSDHLLGAAGVVGSRIAFSALDFTRPENSDVDPTNNVWDLWTYSETEGAHWRVSLPTGGGGGQPVYEWWRHQDFLGDDSRIFWKQANDATGEEVHTIDLTAPDPAATLAIIDLNPGPQAGANYADAVFANGRLYFQGSDGSLDGVRLWTTTDGTDATEVTGPDLTDPGTQFPYLPVAIGDEVFFLARSAGTGSFGVFQVNDDGVTAERITPDGLGGLGGAYALAALGSELYFFAFEPVSNTAQMYRFAPGTTPSVAAPQQLTSFVGIQGAGSMDDIFLGGDGRIYFGRSEPSTGRELWVLDSSEPTGARLVADLNTNVAGGAGYAPDLVVAVPDPLAQFTGGGSGGGSIWS
jgi:ELWxxDGT repeat protein